MNKARVASLVTLIIAVVLVLVAWGTNEAKPAQAAPPAQAPIVSCEQIRISTQQVRIVCSAAGVVVLNTTVSLPQVTLPPVTIGPVTLPPVTIRPPQATVTVRPPGQTETVTVPGPTITVGPSELPTARPTGPVETVTETATVTRQPGGPSATVEPNVSDPVVQNETTTVEKVTKVSLTLLVALIAALIFLYLGYILGYKNKAAKDRRFLASLRDVLLRK